MSLRRSVGLRSFLNDYERPTTSPVSMGGVEHVLTTRDTSQSSNIDPRSLGVGIVIGMLSTLILVSLGFLLSTTFNKSHSRSHNHNSSSKFQSSSRRHLVRSVVGTERITIDDDDPHITFSPASSHNHHHRIGNYDMHTIPPVPVAPSNSLDDEDYPVIDIAPIPPPERAVKVETSSSATAQQFPSGYWTSSPSTSTASPSTSTALQSHSELLPLPSNPLSRIPGRPVSQPVPPVRRSSISKRRVLLGAAGEQRPGHMATPSLGQSPPPPYANLSQTEEGTQ